MDVELLDGKSPDFVQPPLAVIGARSCDLHALRIQDRVFLESGYVDPAYKARRDSLFIAAVNCRRAAATKSRCAFSGESPSSWSFRLRRLMTSASCVSKDWEWLKKKHTALSLDIADY